ncbi:hypothetical protein Tco_0475506 [Tanacetum coccineum]
MTSDRIWILESFEGSFIWWNRDPEIIPRGLAWLRKQFFKRSNYSILFGKVNLDLTPTISEQQTIWCDTTSVEEIRIKDGVIAKLNSRVFKLEAIIKVLGRERKGVSLDKSCVAEIFNNFSSGCWEELNEEFTKLCQTKFCVNGPTMIDLDSDDDLVKEVQRRDGKEKMLKYEEDKKKRRHELMNSDHWKLSVLKISNGKRTQRSSAFSAYYWRNTFAMAEKDRPLNSLNNQDINLFLKDVTPWVKATSLADEEITLVSVHVINVSAGEEVAEEVVEVINNAKLIIDAAQVSAAGDIVSAASEY